MEALPQHQCTEPTQCTAQCVENTTPVEMNKAMPWFKRHEVVGAVAGAVSAVAAVITLFK